MKTKTKDNNNLFDRLVWVSLECVMVYVECRVDDFVISFTHFSHTITERAGQGLMRPKRFEVLCACIRIDSSSSSCQLICSFEGRYRFDQRFSSLRSSIFLFFFGKNCSFSMSKIFILWMGMMNGVQVSVLIWLEWKKGLTCPSPVEHTLTQINTIPV